MSRRKKSICSDDNGGLEYTCPSATEMTGLIPREANDSELDSYESVFPFLPKDKGNGQ